MIGSLCTGITIAKIKYGQNASAGKQLVLSYFVGKTADAIASMENSWEFYISLKLSLPYDPEYVFILE